MHLLPLVKMANNVPANLEEKELYDKREEYELQEIEDNLGSSVSARLSQLRRDWRSQDSGLVFYRHFWNKVIIPPHSRCLEYSLSPLIWCFCGCICVFLSSFIIFNGFYICTLYIARIGNHICSLPDHGRYWLVS